jgi:hypothetical protein
MRSGFSSLGTTYVVGKFSATVTPVFAAVCEFQNPLKSCITGGFYEIPFGV